MKLSEVGGVGIVTKQNATKDIPRWRVYECQETGSDPGKSNLRQESN